jgi:hypothetical protein
MSGLPKRDDGHGEEGTGAYKLVKSQAAHVCRKEEKAECGLFGILRRDAFFCQAGRGWLRARRGSPWKIKRQRKEVELKLMCAVFVEQGVA